MIDDTKLVSTLLKKGVADQATVDEALAKVREGGSLYETLITHQLVAESDLIGLVGVLLDVPSREVELDNISDEVSSLIPASMALRNRVVGLELNDGNLVLGMVDPADELARDEIATHAGVDVQVVLVGPSALNAAHKALYKTPHNSSNADAILQAFDDFEVADPQGDSVLAGDQWSEMFEDSSPLSESSVLSREMQDRPSTDVLAEKDLELDEEDEIPEIEVEIVEELGQPVRRKPPAPFVSLDSWEVDDAIEGESAIVSGGANDLFQEEEEDHTQNAKIELPSEVEETGNLELADEASDAHTDALHTNNKTSVGVGVEQLAAGAGAARAKKKDRATVENTGKTEVGMGPEALVADDAEEAEGAEGAEAHEETGSAKISKIKRAPTRKTGTDYGALGRAILKSSPEQEERDDLPPEAIEELEAKDAKGETAEDELDADDNTNVAARSAPQPEPEPTPKNAREPEPKTAPKPEPIPMDIAPEALEVLPEPRPSPKPQKPKAAVVALFEDDEEFDKAGPRDAKAAKEKPTAGAGKRPTPVRMSEKRTTTPPVLERRTTTPRPKTPASRRGEAEASQAEDRAKAQAAVLPDAGTRPRLISPQIRVPAEVDAEGLALALANLLVSKGILTAQEVFDLAATLSLKKTKK